MRHFKYTWEESLSGEQEHWGKSIWYIELDQEGWTIRQLQIFENGPILKYDEHHHFDENGMLNDQKTHPDEISAMGGTFVSFEEFEEIWNRNES